MSLLRSRHFQGLIRHAREHSTLSSAKLSTKVLRKDAHAVPLPLPLPLSMSLSIPSKRIPLWNRMEFHRIVALAKAYTRAQRTRPYLTQFCSAMVIYFSADISAQSISGKEYDSARTVRSMIIGAIACIPGYHWFMFLSKNFNYSSKILSLATKVSIHQFIFQPVFNTYFFAMQALLAGNNHAQILERLQKTVLESWINSAKIWPIATAFSFTYVPMESRAVFNGLIGLGWQTYLAWLNRKAENAAQARAAIMPAEVMMKEVS